MLASSAQADGSTASTAAPLEVNVPKRMPRFGVAIFDNPSDMSAGWACACDGDSFHFSTLTQLTNDVMWVTSAPFAVFQDQGRQQHNLRRIDFLKTNLLRIASDVGLRTDGHYACAAAHALARVVQQTICIAATVYKWTDPSNELTKETLAEDIRRRMVRPPVSRPHMVSPLMQAFQSNSAPQWPREFEEGVIALTLRLNRLHHARDMLDLPVPDEGWSVEMKGDALQRANWGLDAYLNPDRPSLVEATVEWSGADPALATLAAFGVQAGGRPPHRRWIAQPELRWLSKIAKIHVTRAIMSVQRRFLPEQARLPEALLADPLYAMSISAGLVAENHFQALASEAWARPPAKKAVSAWAVWMRAYDRARMFELAQAAMAQGFVPLNYGGGALTVKLPKARLPDLLKFAEENGIAHPALHAYFVEHGMAQAAQPLVV